MPPTNSNSRNPGSTRRTFLQSAGAVAAGLVAQSSAAGARNDSLALSGGQPAVTYPRRRLTKITKAVLPVHWLGLPCDMDALGDFANQHGLIVLEDAAHAHGASLGGKLMGTWGRMSIFSYQMSKPLPALEGGMGMYQRQEDYERATSFGHSDVPGSFPDASAYRKYAGTGLGTKLRMHPLAAALARAQLRKL